MDQCNTLSGAASSSIPAAIAAPGETPGWGNFSQDVFPLSRCVFVAWRWAALWAPARPCLPACTYVLADDPQGPEDLEDAGAADKLGYLHSHIPQLLVLGAAARWQGPGAVRVSQQLHQSLGALLTQWQVLILLLPRGTRVCAKAGLVLRRGRGERQ